MTQYYRISPDKLFDSSNWEQFQMSRYGNCLIVPEIVPAVDGFDPDTVEERKQAAMEEIERQHREEERS